jgi:hypothetical protein
MKSTIVQKLIRNSLYLGSAKMKNLEKKSNFQIVFH